MSWFAVDLVHTGNSACRAHGAFQGDTAEEAEQAAHEAYPGFRVVKVKPE